MFKRVLFSVKHTKKKHQKKLHAIQILKSKLDSNRDQTPLK